MTGTPFLLTSSDMAVGADLGPPQQLPFTVPAGISSLTVRIELSAAGKRTRIDTVLLGPQGFCGSGMTAQGRLELVVGPHEPSPGVLPTVTAPGEWCLLLIPVNALPNTKASITVSATSGPSEAAASTLAAAPVNATLRQGAGWYKGDLHVHTVHSTGTTSVAQLLHAAEQAGLDFVSVTDHNTISPWPEIALAQPQSESVLLMRGQEVTALWGHMNVHGGSGWADLRLADHGLSAFCEAQRAEGALVCVNHPFSNEAGWQRHDTDWTQIDLIEIHNALEFGHNRMQLDYWDHLLSTGARVVGVGASDCKSPADPKYQFGKLVTWVFAESLSESGVLNGLRSGRVVVSTGPRVDFWAELGSGARIEMGQNIPPNHPTTLKVAVEVADTPVVVFVVRNGLFYAAEVVRASQEVSFPDVPTDHLAGSASFYRVEVHSLSDTAPNGYDRRHRSWNTLLAATNPIWLAGEYPNRETSHSRTAAG